MTLVRTQQPSHDACQRFARGHLPVLLGFLMSLGPMYLGSHTCHAQTSDAVDQRGSVRNLASDDEGQGDAFTGDAELVIDTGAFLRGVSDVAFSPNGTHLAAAGEELVRVWRLHDQSIELVATLRGDFDRTGGYGSCYAVEFTPDGRRLCVGVHDYSNDGNIRVYRVDNLDEIERLLPGHRSPCRKIAFSRDGQHMASQDQDGRILLWDARQWQVRRTIEPRDPQQPDRLYCGFPATRPCLMEFDTEGPHLYDAPSGARIGNIDSGSIPGELKQWLTGFFSERFQAPQSLFALKVWDLRLDEQTWLAAGESSEPGKKFWVSVWSGVSEARPRATYYGHRWHIRCAAIQPGGELAASADEFGEVHVWNRRTGNRHFVVKPEGQPIYEAAFDTPQQGNAMQRILLGTRADSRRWGRNSYGAADQVLRLDERAVVSVKAHTNARPIPELPAHRGMEITFSREGERVRINKQRNGRIEQFYRLRSGAVPTAFTLFDGPASGLTEPVIFGDDGGLLALWDSNTEQVRRAFMGHGGMVTSLSVSPDRKLLLSGSTDRTIRIWSLDPPKPTGTFDFDFQNSAVTRVKPNTSSSQAGVRPGDQIVSIDGKSMRQMYSLMLQGKFTGRPGDRVPVVMSRQGRTYQYQMVLEPGYDFVDPLLNIFLAQNGDWIIWNPRGYYDASPGADRWIGWHVNRGPDKSARFFEIQQFRKQLYRPDIINAIIELADVDQAIELANSRRGSNAPSYDFRNPDQIQEHHPPDIAFLQPLDGTKVDDPRIRLNALVSTVNDLPILDVTLSVNGATQKVFYPAEGTRSEVEIRDYRLRLASGQNVIRLVARNDRATSSAEIYVDTPVRDREPVNAFVLAIGVSKYQHIPSLQFAHKDADQIIRALEGQAGGRLYRSIQTKLVTDAQATRAGIKQGFQWLTDSVSQGQDGAVAFFFFAGHGLLDQQNEFYLAAHDTDQERLGTTAIDWREVITWLHKDLLNCRKVVMLDTCHSGVVETIRFVGIQDPYKELDRQELGTVVFASCNPLQKSVELRKQGHGAFTLGVLESLGDTSLDELPKDALFDPPELFSGLKRRVVTLTEERQNPVYFSPAPLQRWTLLQIRPPQQFFNSAESSND